MGELILLSQRRARSGRTSPPANRAAFFFDLASPFTYLAADRIERLLGLVCWRPVDGAPIEGAPPGSRDGATDRVRAAAERRAAALEVPLSWPERFPHCVRPAMRAAVFAAERGRGGAFALAASRLAYCGGFDLDEPEILAEAAAVAGLPLGECLAAAGDAARDAGLHAAGCRLREAGADRLPAVRVDRTLLCGEERLAEAAARLRNHLPRPVSKAQSGTSAETPGWVPA